MICKSITLLMVAIYFFTPYLIKNINVHCQCGCQEFICYCCKSATTYGNVTSFSECKCNGIDESYIQSPAIAASSSEIEFNLDRVTQVLPCENDSVLPGHKEPPMKPPPTA